MFTTATEAFNALNSLTINSADPVGSKAALMNFVNQLAVEASGTTTVLYSGYIDGVRSGDIAFAMKSDASIRILDKTVAFEILDSIEFKDKVAAAYGFRDASALETVLSTVEGSGDSDYSCSN